MTERQTVYHLQQSGFKHVIAIVMTKAIHKNGDPRKPAHPP